MLFLSPLSSRSVCSVPVHSLLSTHPTLALQHENTFAQARPPPLPPSPSLPPSFAGSPHTAKLPTRRVGAFAKSMTTTSHYPYAPAHDSSTHQSTTASSNALAGSPPSPAFALPTSGAAAAGGGYGASAEGTGAYDGEGGATGTGFFTSNRPGGGAGAGGGAGHALPPAEATGRTFLPPLQPLPPLGGGVGGSSSNNKRPAEGGQGGFGGAHLLSDDETSESGGGTPVASSIANGGGGAGAGGGVASLLGNLPPLAPAPSGSSSTGIGARRTSRAGSAAPSTSGAAAKGKGKAKAAPVTAKDAKAAGKAGGGKKTPQMGVDGKPIQKKKKAGRACAACQKAHLTCDDGALNRFLLLLTLVS